MMTEELSPEDLALLHKKAIALDCLYDVLQDSRVRLLINNRHYFCYIIQLVGAPNIKSAILKLVAEAEQQDASSGNSPDNDGIPF